MPSSSDSASVAMSGSPRPSPGLSGRGTMPRPRSMTTSASGGRRSTARSAHRALAVGVGVHDDVGAGLGDGELDVRQGLVVDLEHLPEPADGMADDGDVLRPCGKGDLEVGKLRLHALRIGRLGHAESGRRSVANLLELLLIVAPKMHSGRLSSRGRPGENTPRRPVIPRSGPQVTTSGRPRRPDVDVGEVIASRRGRDPATVLDAVMRREVRPAFKPLPEPLRAEPRPSWQRTASGAACQEPSPAGACPNDQDIAFDDRAAYHARSILGYARRPTGTLR